MTQKKKITLLDIKHALQDSRFRESLPQEQFADMLREFHKNPGCPCNTKLYRRIIKECQPQIRQYFPHKEVIEIDEELKKLSENHWSVINCNINELEGRLKKLGPGRKQVEIARYEDNVTVVINEIDIIY